LIPTVSLRGFRPGRLVDLDVAVGADHGGAVPPLVASGPVAGRGIRGGALGERVAELVALLAASALGLLVPQDAGARGATPAEKLTELPLRSAGTMDGYTREQFPHWSDAQEYGSRVPAGTPTPAPATPGKPP
jgi:hypothetical protein